MANLFQPSINRVTDDNGNPVNGALMYFYLTGTTTAAPWFTDQAGLVEGTNPLPSNSAGLFAAAYLVPDSTYRIRLTDESGVVIFDIDPVLGYDASSINEDAANISANTLLATTAAQEALVSQNAAAADRLATELAAAAVALDSPLYLTTAAGLAAVGEGEGFFAINGTDATYYTDQSGVAQNEGFTYPSKATVDAAVLAAETALANASTVVLPALIQQSAQATKFWASANESNLYLQTQIDPIDNDSAAFGDSLTSMISSDTSGTKGWVERLPIWIGGTHTNEGVSGQSTDEIAARLLAQNTGELAVDHILLMGANNSDEFTTVMTDIANCVAAITGDVVLLGAAGSGGITVENGAHKARICETLRTTYGNDYVDLRWPLIIGALQDGDTSGMKLGQNPASMTVDSDILHPSKARGSVAWAVDIAAFFRAFKGGAPYVHNDLITWSSDTAPDAVITQLRSKGACSDFALVGGAQDDLFRIDRGTGELLGGGSTDYPANGYRTIYVQGRDPEKGPGHVGRIIAAREAETDQPIYGVRLTGDGSALTSYPVDGEAYSIMPDSTKFSLIMRVRMPTPGQTGGAVFLGMTFGNKSGNDSFAFSPRDTSNATMGIALSTPVQTNADEWHWVMVSIDTVAQTAQAASVSPTDGLQTKTFTGTWSSTDPLGLSGIVGMFQKLTNGASPLVMDYTSIWATKEAAIDWSDSAERDRFFDDSTLAPATMAADGVVNSIAPQIYLRGRVGDALKGRNFAPGGAQLYAPLPIDDFDVAFEEAPA